MLRAASVGWPTGSRGGGGGRGHRSAPTPVARGRPPSGWSWFGAGGRARLSGTCRGTALATRTAGFRGGVAASRGRLQLADGVGECVGCLVEEEEQVALAAVLLPEVEGDGHGCEQRRADYSQAKVVGARSALARGLSWRWIFFINVPVCAIALALAWRGMPDSRERREQPLDVLGLALLSPALAAIIYGLSEAGNQGGFGGGAVIVPLATGAALLVAFAVHALRTRAEPIIDLRLFRSRSFAASAGLMFMFGLSIFGAMLLLPLYYQQARGQSALDAGLALAPQGLGMMVALAIAGRLTDKIGPRPIVLVGIVLATLGTIPYAHVGPGTSALALGASLIIRGAGLGAVIVPAMTAAYRDLRPEAIPRATSAVRILQQVGASFGTAVLAVILQHQASSHAAAGPAGLATAFGNTFWWAVGFTALAFIPALLLPSATATATAAPQPAAAEA